MFNLFKDKIKFVSEHPKIQNNKIILDEIENWFNQLILNEKFFIPKIDKRNKCTGSIYMNTFVNPFKNKEFRTIHDAFIQKETKNYKHKKFNIRIILGVTWRQDYSYDAGAHYGEPFETIEVNHHNLGKIRVIKDCIFYQKEVPRPQFLFSFEFFEKDVDHNNIVKHNTKRKTHIDKGNGTRLLSNFGDNFSELFELNRSQKVRNLNNNDFLDSKPIIYKIEEMKVLYNKFLEDCESVLNKHSVDFEELC